VCRQPGQNSVEDLQKDDLRAKLEEKERKHYLKTKSTNFEEEREEDLRLLEAAAAPDSGGGGGGRTLVPKAIDADDEDDADESDSSGDDDEVGRCAAGCAAAGWAAGSAAVRAAWQQGCLLLGHHRRPCNHALPQDDDEAELLAELERIKKERAEEAARKAAEAAAKADAEQQAELLRGNPLLQEKLAAQGAFLLALGAGSSRSAPSWPARAAALRATAAAGCCCHALSPHALCPQTPASPSSGDGTMMWCSGGWGRRPTHAL
jgi:hypothetical protein